MKFDMKIEGRLYKDCFFMVGSYGNGCLALRLMGDCGGGWPEPVDNITYNIGMVPDPTCQAVVKDNNMERGIVDQLKELGVIKNVIGFTSSGYYDGLPVCEFDMDVVNEYAMR